MFHGQWNPPVDEVLFRNYFSEQQMGTFLECGAGDGVLDSCCLFFEQRDWSGINVEPCKDMYDRLIVNRPRSKNFNHGLSNRNGDLECFTIVQDGAGEIGMMVKHEPHLDALIQRGYTQKVSKMRVTTYDDVIYRCAFERLDLLVLDVEGHELNVFEGMNQVFPSVICVEYSFVGLEALKKTLESKNYKLDFWSFNNAFFSRGYDTVKGWGSTPNIRMETM